MVDGSGASQCFPLYLKSDNEDDSLIDSCDGESKRDGITDGAIERFRMACGEDSITKEDLFHYIYGLLQSPEYRERYKDNRCKDLSRIRTVKKFEDFQAFSLAGRDLAHRPLDYETVDCHPVTLGVCSNGFRQNQAAKKDSDAG